jgi:hypothetical protein
MSFTGSFKPSNSGVAGIRPKRTDWRTKTRRALVDFGRKKNLTKGREKSPHGESLPPGLGKGAKKFVERFMK